MRRFKHGPARSFHMKLDDQTLWGYGEKGVTMVLLELPKLNILRAFDGSGREVAAVEGYPLRDAWPVFRSAIETATGVDVGAHTNV
jgi:hypothetical protein